jgi:aprataxin
MKDPTLKVLSSDKAVVIKDKYPKAKHHFLVLPFDNIPSIYQVSFFANSIPASPQ